MSPCPYSGSSWNAGRRPRRSPKVNLNPLVSILVHSSFGFAISRPCRARGPHPLPRPPIYPRKAPHRAIYRLSRPSRNPTHDDDGDGAANANLASPWKRTICPRFVSHILRRSRSVAHRHASRQGAHSLYRLSTFFLLRSYLTRDISIEVALGCGWRAVVADTWCDRLRQRDIPRTTYTRIGRTRPICPPIVHNLGSGSIHI